MKKRILPIFLLMIIFVTAILSSCHGYKAIASFEVPETFDTSEEINLVFWAKNDTNVTQKKIYQQAVADFEELYPNIKITIVSYTDYQKIYNSVITNIPTKTTPNICISYPDHIATYITGDDIVVPLDELISNEKYGLGGSELLFDGPTSDEMCSKFLQECEIDGVTYAVPFMRSSEALYINKTLVEAMGYEIPDIVTWDWIWEVSEKAMEKDENGLYKVNGQSTLIPFIYKSSDNMMIQLAKQTGTGYSTDGGKILLFNDETKDILLEIYSHAATGAFSTFDISGYPGNFFNAGQCIFAIDSTAGATWMGSNAPLSEIPEESIASFETVVRPVPQVDTENPQMISQGPSICIFNKENPQEVLASWLFVQYLLTNEVQIAYAQTEGYIPVTLKAQESEEYLDYLSRSGEDNSLYYDVKIEASKLVLENINNTFVTAVFNGSTSLRKAAGSLVDTIARKARRGEEASDEFFDTLYEKMISQYELEQDSLGEMPSESIALLAILLAIWLLILLYFAIDIVKKNKTKQQVT